MEEVRISLSDVIKGVNILNEKVLVGPPPKIEETKVENPIETARKKAEEILKKAKEDSAKLLKEARANAKMIEEKAKKDGYASGYQAGMKDVQKQIKEAVKFVNSLKKTEEDFFDKIKEAIVDLTVATVKEIVFSEVTRGSIEKKVERALDAVKASKKITIKVSEQAPAQLIEKLSLIEKVQVLPLSTFDKMDVQVEADFGTLDLRVDSQLELFERLVRKSMGEA